MCVADQSVDIELFWVAVPLLAKWLFKKKQNPVDRVLKEEKKIECSSGPSPYQTHRDQK